MCLVVSDKVGVGEMHNYYVEMNHGGLVSNWEERGNVLWKGGWCSVCLYLYYSFIQKYSAAE